MSKPYKLSASLTGHKDDIKGVRFISPSTVLSCSRDSSVRIWRKDAATQSASDAQNGFDDSVNSMGNEFVNAVAYMEPTKEHANGLVISGGKDALIDVREAGSVNQEAEYLLVGHAGNVCCLDIYEETIISGSWDQTAIVWKNWELAYTLGGHGAAVWAVLALSDSEFITGCADKKIRWWKNDKQIRSIEAHPEPVRGLCKLPNGGIASCGNDGTIRTWTIDGQPIDIIHGHTAFIYSIVALPSGELVSSGEDRTVRVWRGTACLQTITHPAISVWSVAVCPETGDIVSGASDKILRIFSRDPSSWASESTLKAFDDVVASSSIPEQAVGTINKEKLPGPEALHRAGKHDGETIMINAGADVEAYSWSQSETTWTQIGVVTGSVGNTQKQTYEGKDYDYVFDVDFEEGKPPLKLPFNASQNPFDAARIFLERNELPLTYLETTANFIVQNTTGTTIGQRSAPEPTSWGGADRYQPGDPPPPLLKQKILPQTAYLDIAIANYAAITKKILDTNTQLLEKGEKDASLNPEEQDALKALVKFLEKPSAPTSASAKSSQAVINGLNLIVKIIKTWTTMRIPGIDLLRLLARYSPAVPLYEDEDGTIVDVLASSTGFDKVTPNNVMLSARAFTNMFHTAEGLTFVDNHFDEIFKHISAAATGSTNRNLTIAYITLLLNYAVHFNKAKSDEHAVTLIETLSAFLKDATDAEAIYRAMVAMGTSITAGELAKQSAKDIYGVPAVVSKILQTASESRIKDVGKEIEELLKGKGDVTISG